MLEKAVDLVRSIASVGCQRVLRITAVVQVISPL